MPEYSECGRCGKEVAHVGGIPQPYCRSCRNRVRADNPVGTKCFRCGHDAKGRDGRPEMYCERCINEMAAKAPDRTYDKVATEHRKRNQKLGVDGAYSDDGPSMIDQFKEDE